MNFGDWLLWVSYFVALLAIIGGYGWTIVLYFAGNRYLEQIEKLPTGVEQDFLWVFMVPALNEGVTIADSVSRLRAVQATHKMVLVINDGSEDNTGEVLASIAGPDLEVLTRVPPNARVGKAAALNAAFAFVRDELMNKTEWARFTRDQTIFVIVDADGRLAANAPTAMAKLFANPQVGGVQANVHIYNQDTWLTRMQALEFRIFGGLYQLGRASWGAAFMGGNGQFNRMTALESVANEEGPWSHFLTEDQELGLRLLQRGWLGLHSPETQVSQQGVNSLKRLYKQRTRWFQGNLQVVKHVNRLYAHYLHGYRRLDATFTLILPVMQLIVGFALILSLIMWAVFQVPYLTFSNPFLLLFYFVLATGPSGLSVLVMARGQGFAGLVSAIRVTPSYFAYTWVMWPVVFRGLWQQIRGNTVWDKTAREAVKK